MASPTPSIWSCAASNLRDLRYALGDKEDVPFLQIDSSTSLVVSRPLSQNSSCSISKNQKSGCSQRSHSSATRSVQSSSSHASNSDRDSKVDSSEQLARSDDFSGIQNHSNSLPCLSVIAKSSHPNAAAANCRLHSVGPHRSQTPMFNSEVEHIVFAHNRVAPWEKPTLWRRMRLDNAERCLSSMSNMNPSSSSSPHTVSPALINKSVVRKRQLLQQIVEKTRQQELTEVVDEYEKKEADRRSYFSRQLLFDRPPLLQDHLGSRTCLMTHKRFVEPW